jgi:hypothetical protein
MSISSIWSGKKIENASVSILRWNGQQYKLELEAEPGMIPSNVILVV